MPRAELGKRRSAPHGSEECVDRPLVHRDHRDDLLREDVQGIPRIPGALDLRVVHRTRDGRAGDEVAPKLGHDDAAAGLADRVPGSPDALHPARDRGRRLNLDDEVDGAHVDAELERRGGDQPADEPGLEAFFDLDPLRPRDRPVVCAHQRLAGELVERARQPLGDAPAVDENQRRAMRRDELEQTRVYGRPDRRSHRTLCRGPAGDVLDLADAGHVLDRHFDRQVEPFLLRGVDDGDGTVAPRRCFSAARRRSAQESGHLVERALRGGEADALERCGVRRADRFEPLEREREVSATLGRNERVDLVDDHRIDGAERVAGVRRQEEVQRLGRRDQDVGRIPLEPCALDRGRIAGPDRDGRHVMGLAASDGAVRDAGKRRAKVPLDVDRQRLER